MKVSVIIPNYNGKEFIEKCMISLEKQIYQDYEIILVDNGSLDGSRSYIQTHYPDIKFIPLDKNYGFSYAVNVGIKESRADYVVLLNNDTEVDEGWLGHLVDCIESDPRIFSCSSKMIRYKERHLIDDAGDEYCILGWTRKRGDGKPVELYKQNRRVFSSCAGAAIYRRSIFGEIGYFDEDFFAYMEDVDIGYRANIYGYKNVYCSQAVVYHIGSATTGAVRHNGFKVKLSARNNIYLYYKNMPFFQRIINKPFLWLGWFIKYIYFSKKGFREEYLNGTREGKKNKKQMEKVSYQSRHLKHYFRIQGILLRNLWGYFQDE